MINRFIFGHGVIIYYTYIKHRMDKTDGIANYKGIRKYNETFLWLRKVQ